MTSSGPLLPFRNQCDLFGILVSGGIIATPKINSKCHFSTLYHIICFGTGLQVDSNYGERGAGISEEAFDLCKT